MLAKLRCDVVKEVYAPVGEAIAAWTVCQTGDAVGLAVECQRDLMGVASRVGRPLTVPECVGGPIKGKAGRIARLKAAGSSGPAITWQVLCGGRTCG